MRGWVAAMVFLLAGCGVEESCDLVGASFRSIRTYECSGGEDPEFCHWFVEFGESRFAWQYEDTFINGEYL